jgi:diguanylate cyclase (GGDEF)-like protein
MIPLTDSFWINAMSRMVYSFQPIVNIHTGICYAYEALLRGWKEAGFESIESVFDAAYSEKCLHNVELALRAKAIGTFSKIPEILKKNIKLFLNLDPRVLSSGDYRPGNTIKILHEYNLPQDSVCFEISERIDPVSSAMMDVLSKYRFQGFRIAMDDFGTGFSGLKMLYYTEPDFIKIDRFFISEMEKDSRKRLFASKIVEIAHILGSLVIAEGVETEAEYYTCKRIGCDLVQGYFIQKPQIDLDELRDNYHHIGNLSRNDRRQETSGDRQLIVNETVMLPHVSINDDIFSIFQKFRQEQKYAFFPILDDSGEPLGIIQEKSLKDYAYSRYGISLLQNPSVSKNIRKFITRYPVADIHSPISRVLEMYAQDQGMEGIIMVDRIKYAGFLSASSLLRIINEKNIEAARDQNPLSGLPGNTLIYEYVSNTLEDTTSSNYFVYFDFDHFKAFNDTYGFRRGDRAILLFADILKKLKSEKDVFIGHIGGDDFFMSIGSINRKEAVETVRTIIETFRKNVESFYDTDAIVSGFIETRDRSGKMARFPLMTVSAVIIEIHGSLKSRYSSEQISGMIARLKPAAKATSEKLCIAGIDTETDVFRSLKN